MSMQSDPRAQTSSVNIKINGQPLGPDVAAKVADVIIDQDMVLPDTFAIRLHDIQDDQAATKQTLFPLLDGDNFRIGKEVEISLGREDRVVPALTGEITSLELEMRGDGLPLLTVRGFDKAHRLNRQKQTKVYVNQKVSDIVRAVAARNGLSATIEDTQVVYPHMFQDNQTDWEFARALAREVGKQVFVRGSSLSFSEPEASG